jgi:hypothetical protein
VAIPCEKCGRPVAGSGAQWDAQCRTLAGDGETSSRRSLASGSAVDSN